MKEEMIGKSVDRRLTSWEDRPGTIVLRERFKVPLYDRKWTDNTVALSLDELRKLATLYLTDAD